MESLTGARLSTNNTLIFDERLERTLMNCPPHHLLYQLWGRSDIVYDMHGVEACFRTRELPTGQILEHTSQPDLCLPCQVSRTTPFLIVSSSLLIMLPRSSWLASRPLTLKGGGKHARLTLILNDPSGSNPVSRQPGDNLHSLTVLRKSGLEWELRKNQCEPTHSW
jgi:hypothetical protein